MALFFGKSGYTEESPIDISMVKLGIQQVPVYKVLYKFHKKEKPPDFSITPYNILKRCGNACYSGVFNNFKDGKVANGDDYITSLFLTKVTTGKNNVTFSEEHARRWIELCTKYKLLPPSFLANYSVERCICRIRGKDEEYLRSISTMYIDGVLQPTMYMWLDNFRHIAEDQGLVMATIYLHDTVGIDFYEAYVLASYDNISNSGHHSLVVSRNSLYDMPKTASKRPSTYNGKEVIDLKFASVLYQACNNFPELLSRNNYKSSIKFIQKNGGDRATGWRCNSIQANICSSMSDLLIPIRLITHENVGKIIRARKDEDRKSLLKMMK